MVLVPQPSGRPEDNDWVVVVEQTLPVLIRAAKDPFHKYVSEALVHRSHPTLMKLKKAQRSCAVACMQVFRHECCHPVRC